MIRIAHMFSSMRKGGGAELSILSLIRGMDRSRFENFLILNERKQPEHDLSGIEVLPPHCAAGEKPWWAEWRFAFGVAREVRHRRIDILHSHSPTGHDRLAFFLGGLSGAAVVRTLRGYNPPRRRSTGCLCRLFDTVTKQWTAISPDLIPVLVDQFKVKESRISVIPNGIDLQAFTEIPYSREEIRKTLGIGPDELFIVSVGRLVEEKDYATLLSALHRVKSSISGSRVWIIGEGNQRRELEDQIHSQRLGMVRLCGYREDVPAILKAADIFVMTSLREGFGRAAAEAMAAGCPVIATRVSGLRFVVNDAGLLIPPGNPEALASALEQLAQQPETRQKLGAMGRKRATTLFSAQAMVDAYSRLYEKIMMERQTEK